MKHFTKISCSTLLLLASISSYAENKKEPRVGSYSKINIDLIRTNTLTEKGSEDVQIPDIKSKLFLSEFSFGLGYYFNDFFRTDFMLGIKIPELHKTKQQKYLNRGHFFTFNDEDTGETMRSYAFFNRKITNHYSVMLNNYIDLPVNEKIAFFWGVGFGLIRLEEKVKIGFGKYSFFPVVEKSFSSKNTNFTYSLITGISLKVTPTTYMEISYIFKDLGKTKYKLDEYWGQPDNNHYKGHGVVVGFRYNI